MAVMNRRWFQSVTELPAADIIHLKTDVFRQRVAYAEDAKQRLVVTRRGGEGEIDAVRAEIAAGLEPLLTALENEVAELKHDDW